MAIRFFNLIFVVQFYLVLVDLSSTLEDFTKKIFCGCRVASFRHTMATLPACKMALKLGIATTVLLTAFELLPTHQPSRHEKNNNLVVVKVRIF